jgi:hypothetical protein
MSLVELPAMGLRGARSGSVAVCARDGTAEAAPFRYVG